MSDKDRIDLSMFLDDYLNDCREGFQQINNALLVLEKDRSQSGRLDEVFRIVHTLKSSSTMLEFHDIAKLAHICEDLLDYLRKSRIPITQETMDVLFEVVDTLDAMVGEQAEGKGHMKDFQTVAGKVKSLLQEEALPAPQEDGKANAATMPSIEKIQTIRVHVDLLDSLFNLVGELIITKNRIDNLVSETMNKELKAALSAMDHMITELNENVSVARLVPVDDIFQKFPRMVRDLAKDAHKEVELVIEGREIELDKGVLDAIGEPLIHLLRNAVDHGIEPPDERHKQNKKRSGTIVLSARRTENHILIDVEDDGGGIDIARVRDVAIGRGLIRPEEVEYLTDKDVLDLLFSPGFSSTESITDVSGRGIGLDIVRASVKRLGGTVEVTTQRGQGTKFTLTLPLATTIMQTLMVSVGDHLFAIPSDIILETLEVKPEDIREIRDRQVLILRQEAIPFTRLNDVLNIARPEDQKEMIAVIMYRGDNYVSLGVDAVLDQMENIIKPFDPIAQRFQGFSGGTILGDGRVVLLLDIPTLFGFETLREERCLA